MVFNSFYFIFYCCGVIALYYLAKNRWRKIILTAASIIYFASWSLQYLVLMLVTASMVFWIGVRIEKQDAQNFKNRYLLFGISLVFGQLYAFKYYNFSLETIWRIFNLPGAMPFWEIVAPVGILFYSLQMIAYLIDIYKSVQPAEKKYWDFILFIFFFPQVLAGPIPRAKQLLPQIRQKIHFDQEKAAHGFRLVLWGLFQKIVIADRLGMIVSKLFDSPSQYQGATLMFVLYLYSAQIYCDFAGYSNIAIGIAKILGFDLIENFNYPYLAKDLTEFWNRWHISLSTWLRDYIFYPVMRWLRKRWKSKYALLQLALPPLISMFASGLWHGAKMNFVVWGLLHGIFLFLFAWSREVRTKIFSIEKWGKLGFLSEPVQIFITINIVTLLWVFFRADTVADAWMILSKLMIFNKLNILENLDFIEGIFLVTTLIIVEGMQLKGYNSSWLANRPLALRWGIYYLVIILILFFDTETITGFIYAQF